MQGKFTSDSSRGREWALLRWGRKAWGIGKGKARVAKARAAKSIRSFVPRTYIVAR